VDDSNPKLPNGDETPKKADSQPIPEEIRLFAAHWPEILREMNKILAQEEN
jgi:hypothetical protein